MRKKKLDKSSKFAIHIIILKDIASNIRKENPDLRVEAHPCNDSYADLFIGRRDADTFLKFRLQRHNHYNSDTSIDYKLIYTLTTDGKKKKRASQFWATDQNSIAINLQTPDSIHKMKEWIDSLMGYLYVDTQSEKKCVVDIN